MAGTPTSPASASRLRRSGALGVCALALVLLASGCGHLGLARRTIQHGSTLSDMQFQQVLDNLAMFSCNPDSLAWHVKITGGVVQLADQGAGGIAGNLGGPGIVAPSGSLQRNVLGQWNIDPVIETEELELLQIAYKKALNPFDFDGSLKREAYAKICDLANSYHISVSRDIALDMIDVMSEGATPTQMERITQIRSELTRLYDEIDRESIAVQPYDQQRIDRTGPEVTNRVEYLREQVIRLLFEACQRPVGQVRAYHRPGRNVGLVEQAEDKIEALLKLFDEDELGPPNRFNEPWVCFGCKDDLPPCACLVGKYKGCEGECFAWILPGATVQFRDFVLIILALAPPSSQDISPTPAGFGAANNPNF